jgi:hypothetical protein
MAYRSFSLSGFEARGVRKVYPPVDFKRGSEKLPTPSLRNEATPSNCRKVLLSQWYRLHLETSASAGVKATGMVTTYWIGTIGSQVLRVLNLWMQFTD